ncbi:MAG: hypothetical protein B6U88_00620 [Candidatus Aenigmarchaeota archaeon ex4484_56]|nr:MAG: hypothetical protein B6U88_00620 [Candidatus Aenigmarchaeota archaeon ex4484_56]
MRRLISLVLLISILIIPIHSDYPASYENKTIIVEIHENKLITETILIDFPKEVSGFNYYITHPVKDVEIYAYKNKINCDVFTKISGTLISCKNIRSKSIELKYKYSGLISEKQGYFIYSDRFIISTPTKYFNLRVYLPKGYVIYLDKSTENSYYPYDGKQGTDGQRIYIEWKREPKLGEIYDVSIFYEEIIKSKGYFMFLLIFVSVLLIIFILLLFFKPKLKIDALTEHEKKFLEVVMNEKKVSQKKICQKTNFSKALVSRIAKSLEERGVIERVKKGRKYEIRIKRR